MRPILPSEPYKHRGAVLFVALVFLILLTLLALTAAGTSVLEERMTGGMRNSQLSLMGAETAARGVEWSIWKMATTSTKLNCGYNGGTNHCFGPVTMDDGKGKTKLQINPLVDTFRIQKSWSSFVNAGKLSDKLTGLSGTQEVASLAAEPQYIIEQLGVVLPPGVNSVGEGGAIYQTGGKGAGNLTLYAYRITSRSPGGSNATTRAVETYFTALPPTN